MIEADRIAAARGAFSQWVRFVGDARKWPYRSNLVLIGCITYSSPLVSKPHQTSFTHRVERRKVEGGSDSVEQFDLTTLAVIPADQIKVTEERWGEIVDWRGDPQSRMHHVSRPMLEAGTAEYGRYIDQHDCYAGEPAGMPTTMRSGW